MSLLEVEDLTVRFGDAVVVDRLSFSVEAGETLAIVGESGCGKSMTALALTRLVGPPGRIGGRVRLDGLELTGLPEPRMRAVRGDRIGIVFQDPMSALNPVLTVGEQVAEAVRAHSPLGTRAARARAAELLDLVHIPDAHRRLDDHPHRFSGGMRQRVAIAIAIAANPALLIADEPTTALDVTIQAQILCLLDELRRDLGMGLILITHDLGVVAETADRVLVMYAGRKVEEQDTPGLFAAPLHPYTRRLMGAKPRLTLGEPPPRQRLQEIPGLVPLPGAIPPGCAFAPRCADADAGCAAVPPLQRHGRAAVACHKVELPAWTPRQVPRWTDRSQWRAAE
ncbi:ABC transporter ATP-binding protein [Azospirillum sp. TSH64]|uniref:ABC transporter ATP-binding protein n=1 Tax=Azospirillum sp. TSH64 TaxID=652740 RepID=UPI0018EEB58E|nr:ABC transporter ATP-binding protein [Azospirillum sp. TSH64]